MDCAYRTRVVYNAARTCLHMTQIVGKKYEVVSVYAIFGMEPCYEFLLAGDNVLASQPKNLVELGRPTHGIGVQIPVIVTDAKCGHVVVAFVGISFLSLVFHELWRTPQCKGG